MLMMRRTRLTAPGVLIYLRRAGPGGSRVDLRLGSVGLGVPGGFGGGMPPGARVCTELREGQPGGGGGVPGPCGNMPPAGEQTFGGCGRLEKRQPRDVRSDRGPARSFSLRFPNVGVCDILRHFRDTRGYRRQVWYFSRGVIEELYQRGTRVVRVALGFHRPTTCCGPCYRFFLGVFVKGFHI